MANAGVGFADTHRASAGGYEPAFAINHVAHAQLIGELLDSFLGPARIVLLGSNTHHQNIFRRDHLDSTRAVSPLRAPADAMVVDATAELLESV